MTAPLPLNDLETERLCSLWEKTRRGDFLTPAEEIEADALAKRIKIRNWPRPIIPPGEMHPQITIPKPIPASMIAIVSHLLSSQT